MDNRVAASLKMRRFIAFLLNGLAAMGLVLSIVGLYGSLAHLVALRQREIGIRVALGAMQSQVIRLVLVRAGAVVAAGLTAGLVVGGMAGRLVQSQLFGVQLTDITVWAGVVCAMLVATAISASFPAWRAACIEPSAALRNE
jgi:ABC-type antimicrobial peptide transport system permease subunit